jgi:hypothetical protein
MRGRNWVGVAAGVRTALAIACTTALLAGCSSNGSSVVPNPYAGQTPSGYVSMQEVQVAYIGSGSTGSGTLTFRGQTYPFGVGGLGVGGIGASTINASGEVYNLTNVGDFAGAYGQGRYGFALGEASGGDLWLENPNGVVMHLRAEREGLMLSLGGDAVVITMQ